ncbi:DNA gyrase subunit A [Metamycoplasma hyosynoviae]|uniref:DNA gyrase subunit A n=1 Tax=Metamycoplasma hyosynoviae TaxID=29559 RepID=UPI00235E424C|nr:DNA gyrase subunit A [Metamycoplasma hyosynoviae]MDD1360764.1 DNA gyrase subunit A [Metamycoplasma hyosynoviae]MDD1361970.1 DNA gyrase subunit A [Metamycoplasma hyosynoviae]
MPSKKDEKEKKSIELEEKKLDNQAPEDDDQKYYDFDDTIKKVFEEPKSILPDEDEEEEIPQAKEGYKVKSQILETETNGLKPADLAKVMKSSFIEYAMSVIVARALPDARDGFKPVHRRILYAMSELGILHNSPHKKSARIVGEVLGKYHPHGDSSVYEAMVRMAQDFSMRYPLIDGHGNFGSVDGDEAAAMRYTEARMSKIATAMVDGLKKNTVDFIDNYDGSEKEPVVLPARFPNLLISGTSGIAVGMATNIPPHNLGEVIDAVCALAKNPEITIDELMEYVLAPDFPTRGIIFNRAGLIEAYKTGRGSITMRARAHIQEFSNGKSKIIITEIPYEVKKTEIMEKIADHIKNKRIDGIADFRDESNRDGIRITIDVKKTFVPEVILNQLYKLTRLQTNFSFNMISLVNNEPKLLNLKQCLEVYLAHQIEVVTRRLNFDLEKDLARAHILEGLKICVENIDKVIEIIKKSKNDTDAQEALMKEFRLSDLQAKAIVDMRLGRLTGLAIEKMEEELEQVQARIVEYRSILSNHSLLIDLIIKELQDIKNTYGDKRRSEINWDEMGNIDNEDLIPQKEIVITISSNSYVKRIDLNEYREQKRGGVGSSTVKTYQDDDVRDILVTNTHTDLLIFTNQARVYRIRGHEIPIGTKQAKGTPIINIIPAIDKNEKIIKIISINEYNDNNYLITVSKRGIIKKTKIAEYQKINKNGKFALSLNEGDELIDALIGEDNDEIFIAGSNSRVNRFNISEVRSMGRTATGVGGIRLDETDEVVTVSSSKNGKYIFSIGARGFGKMTLAESYRKTKRNSRGVLALNSEKAGNLVYASTVHGTEDLIIMSKDGIAIRFSLRDVSIVGRNSKGVKLINLKGRNSSIVGVAKIYDESEVQNDRELTKEEYIEVTREMELDLSEDEDDYGDE